MRNILKRLPAEEVFYWLKHSLWSGLTIPFRKGELRFPSIQKLRIDATLRISTSDSFLPVLNRLKQLAQQMDVTPSKTGYELYYDSKLKALSANETTNLDDKQKVVVEMIRNCKGQRWLDLGSNTGWYARELLRKGADVIAVEADEFCADQLYLFARDKKQKMLVVIDDVAEIVQQWPYCIESPLRLLQYTYRVDGCLMLGLLHHLVLGRGLSTVQIIAFLKDAAQKTVILEFVGLNDTKIQDNPEVFPHASNASNLYYSLDEIIVELRKYFSQVETYPSDVLARRMIVASN